MISRTGRDTFLWGRLRLWLGLAQIGLAAAALVLLLTSGLSAVTWLLFIAATAATVASRTLYAGRKGPEHTHGRERHER